MSPRERRNLIEFIQFVYGYSPAFLKAKNNEQIEYLFQRAVIKAEYGKWEVLYGNPDALRPQSRRR